jgi:prophage DNA circulation protein
VVHEFALRRLPGFEDLTERDGIIRVNGWLSGADVLSQRDALLAVFKERGSGRLELPWLPPAQCVTASLPEWQYNAQEGEYVAFSIEFLPVEALSYPVGAVNNRAAVKRQASEASAAAAAEFANVFSVQNKPEFVRQSAITQLNEWFNQFEAARTLRGASAVANSAFDWSLYLARQAQQLQNPKAMASQLLAVFEQVTETVTTPLQAVSALREAWGYQAQPPSYNDTPSRQTQAQNAKALDQLLRTAALTNACQAAAAASYDSHQQAIEIRDLLLAEIDDQMSSADRNTWMALNSLYSAVSSDLTQRSERLGRVSEYTPQTTQPCALISQELYGTGARGAEIFARNSHLFDHPGFAPAGVALEVVTND